MTRCRRRRRLFRPHAGIGLHGPYIGCTGCLILAASVFVFAFSAIVLVLT